MKKYGVEEKYVESDHCKCESELTRVKNQLCKGKEEMNKLLM